MLKKIYLLILLVFGAYSMYAQANVDSLKKTLQGKKADSNYIKTLLAIAHGYSNKNPDSSVRYADKVVQLSSSSQTLAFVISAYQYKGYAGYIKGEYQQAIDDYKKMYALAEKAGDKKNMAAAINNQGNVFIELGNLTQAIDMYRQSMKIAEDIKDEFLIAKSYNNIGYVYKELGEYTKANENMVEALKVFEKLSLVREASNTYNIIAAIYARQKNLDKALEYNNIALNIQQKNNLPPGMGISLQGIANIYAERKEYAKALDAYHKASVIYEGMKDKRQLALMYANVGNMYNLWGNLDSSEAYYDKAIALNRQINNVRNLASALTGNAATLINAGKLDKAKILLDSTEALFKINNKKEDYKQYYQILSDYYAARGDAKMSLDYFRRYATQKDELVNEQNLKAIADLNIKYETEKKQLQIELLNKNNSLKDLQINKQKLALSQRAYQLAKQQLALTAADLTISNNQLEIKNKNELLLKSQLDSARAQHKLAQLNEESSIQKLELQNQRLLNSQKNTLITGILILVAILCLLAYLFYTRYRLRQQQKLQSIVLHEQEQAAKAVLQAEESERVRIARDLHDGIGQMMSAAKMNLSAVESEMHFNNTQQKQAFERVINLIDNSLSEVRSVSHSMMPNALMKEGLASALREFVDQIDQRVLKVQLHTEGLNGRMDQNIESVLYRVIQECVSNAIKHAHASNLDISLIKTASTIDATIEDDGKGFNTVTALQSIGIGFKNMRSRIEYLKGEIEWNSSPGKGTLVSFHVPV